MDALPLINEKIIINKKDDKRMTKYWQCMEEKRMIKKLDTDDIKSNCTEMDALPLNNEKMIINKKDNKRMTEY